MPVTLIGQGGISITVAEHDHPALQTGRNTSSTIWARAAQKSKISVRGCMEVLPNFMITWRI